MFGSISLFLKISCTVVTENLVCFSLADPQKCVKNPHVTRRRSNNSVRFFKNSVVIFFGGGVENTIKILRLKPPRYRSVACDKTGVRRKIYCRRRSCTPASPERLFN